MKAQPDVVSVADYRDALRQRDKARAALREAEKKLALAIRPYEFEQLQAENLSLRQQLAEAKGYKALYSARVEGGEAYWMERAKRAEGQLLHLGGEVEPSFESLDVDPPDWRRAYEKAEQQLERLREALRECIDHAEEGWSYASDYFREKWGAEEGLEKARSALAELEKGEAD